MSSSADDSPYPTWPPSPTLDAQLSEMRQLIVTWTELFQHGLRDVHAIRQRLYGLQLAYNAAADYAIARAPTVRLSPRELEILRRVAQGMKNREIGAELGLSAGTVKNHMTSILSKLNAHNRREAAARARLLGIV